MRKVVGSRFVIVSGNLSYRTVQDFLSEFYHPLHDKDMLAFPFRVVIMDPYKPLFEMKTLLANYKDRQVVNPDAEDVGTFLPHISQRVLSTC